LQALEAQRQRVDMAFLLLMAFVVGVLVGLCVVVSVGIGEDIR
jgi:hypothetical protein